MNLIGSDNLKFFLTFSVFSFVGFTFFQTSTLVNQAAITLISTVSCSSCYHPLTKCPLRKRNVIRDKIKRVRCWVRVKGGEDETARSRLHSPVRGSTIRRSDQPLESPICKDSSSSLVKTDTGVCLSVNSSGACLFRTSNSTSNQPTKFVSTSKEI